MSIDFRSTKQPMRSNCPQLSRAQRAAMAMVAVLVSGTLLGGMLSLFELRSAETAMAQAAVTTQPTAELAVRKIASEPRG